MPAFFLTFFATALVLLAGRDAVRVARLAVAHGRIGMLLLAVGLAAAAYAALAAWLAGGLEQVLDGPAARLFVALALGIAGVEVLVLRSGQPPAEPTRSLGATLLVLLAGLLTGAAGFLVLALAVLTESLALAAAGGAAGAFVALALAALAGAGWDRVPHAALRWLGGGALLVAALVTGVTGLGLAP